MKLKSIDILVHSYPPNIGGIEVAVHEEVKFLELKGINVKVFTSQTNKPDTVSDTVKRYWSFKPFNAHASRLFSPMLIIDLLKSDSQVIEAHGLSILPIIGAFVAQIKNKPFYYHLHGAPTKGISKLITELLVWYPLHRANYWFYASGMKDHPIVKSRDKVVIVKHTNEVNEAILKKVLG